MTRKEQERKGKEIVERLNKGKEISGFNISYFYNIKQLYFIKTEEINSKEFYLIVLPIDKNKNSLLEIKIYIYYNKKLNIFFICSENIYYNHSLKKYYCFTKFNLTGNYWEEDNLDYWLVRKIEKFRWIKEYLKEDNPEYNLAMYELYGFNEEYVRRELGYFKDTRNYIKEYRYEKDY